MANQSTSVEIEAQKQIQSNSSTTTGDIFQFRLLESGQVIAQVSNDENGDILFPQITYDTIGEHDYQIAEIIDNPPKPGWRYDYHYCSVHVSVTRDPVTEELVAKLTYNPDIKPNFINIYTCTQAPVTIQNKIIAHGSVLQGGTFGFDLVDENGNTLAHATHDSDGNIVFPSINLPIGDHDLQIVAPPDKDGWVFDKRSVTVHVQVRDNGDGTSTGVVTYPADPNFNVTYTPAPGKVEITAHKVINGWTLPTKSVRTFTFVLKDSQGNVVKRVQATDGTVDFGQIDITAAGVLTYTISEEGSDEQGWVLDKGIYPVTVTVNDDGEGHLVGSVDHSPNLTNIYKPAPVTIGEDDTPKANKSISGHATLEDGQFTFGVFDQGGHLITIGTNDANGQITFPTVTFDEAGEHNYTIQETTPDGGGFTTDKATYPYQIVITDDGLGALHATVTQPTPTPTFVNTYSAAGSEDILAYKSLQGWDSKMTAPNFTFILNDQSGQPIKTIQSSSGTLDFGVLEYTEPGDYTYTVNEETPLPPAWATPIHSYRIIVHMEPDGKGGLIGTISYPDSGDVAPEFVNTYTSTPANVGGIITNNPSGQYPSKTISGSHAALQDSQFKFGIYDESGNLVAYGFNDANGRIRVPVFFLSQLGTWNYSMKEITSDGKGWTTDQTSYPMQITISDDGVGHRVAQVQYPSGAPAFHNIYQAADATANIKGKVIGTGKTVDDGEFHFDLVDGDGKKVGEVKNDGNGNILFPPLHLPEGDYHYRIVAPPNGNGWTFDVPNLPVNVHVTDNGDGTNAANVTYPNGDTFHPTYKPLQPAHATVRTRKGVYGATLLADEFTFVLEGDDGSQYATAKNDACGNVTFPQLTFTKPGVYHYTISELCVSTDLWRCDSSTFGVTITVKDDGQGELTASVRYGDGSVQMFKNYYKPAGYS